MEFGLKGRVVLVTGASSGIGRATAVAFAREGAKVALTYKSKREEAEKTADSVRAAGGEAWVLAFDLEDEASPRAVIHGLAEHWGALDVLVNNAVRWPSGFTSLEESRDWRAVVRGNVEGTMGLIQAAIPLMRKSGGGRIVNVSSGLAVDGLPGSSAYTAAKAALHGLTRTLAKELAPQGILVNVVMAGTVASEARPRPAWLIQQMSECAATGRMTLADEVARSIVFLGSLANGHTTGELLRTDGFFVTPPRAMKPPA
jgi:3-oxoacyl-[acyl-carrier protein] reductase